MELYKILSLENWQKSQAQETLLLSDADTKFVHFSTLEQLERILQKYWSDGSEYVVLKVNSEKLLGRLVLEANPGGVNQYSHLYNGGIPIEAVEEQRFSISSRVRIVSSRYGSLKVMDGFKGGLSAKKNIAITKCSHATGMRD